MPNVAPPPRPNRPIVPRWIGVMFPSVILAAIVFGIAYVVNITIVPFVLALAVSAGLGFLSGFTARWALRHRHVVVRILAALAGLTIGLLLLGLMTLGDAGIGPLNYSLGGPDWGGLSQLTIGIATALLTLFAWRASASSTQGPPRATALTLSGRMRARGAQMRDWWERSTLHRGLTRVGQSLAQSQEMRPVQRSATRRRPVVRESRSETPPPPVQPNRFQVLLSGWKEGLSRKGKTVMNWRSRLGVRVGEVAEHRCPFCLDTIRRNDPRGTVVCPICHTPHHADCWAVTGMCQIPHQH